MDISLLLLVCFLSVFHISRADQPLEDDIIVPRKVPLLGGWNEMSPESQDVQEAAKKAVEKFNTKSKAKKYFKLINVTSAYSQVTNRINYTIKAIIGKTKCLKSDNANIESCGMAKKQLACIFEVSFNPMNDRHAVEIRSCNKAS